MTLRFVIHPVNILLTQYINILYIIYYYYYYTFLVFIKSCILN